MASIHTLLLTAVSLSELTLPLPLVAGLIAASTSAGLEAGSIWGLISASDMIVGVEDY
jgi:hypothetical protein